MFYVMALVAYGGCIFGVVLGLGFCAIWITGDQGTINDVIEARRIWRNKEKG